jgi:RND family efflux transporter MFP subunit
MTSPKPQTDFRDNLASILDKSSKKQWRWLRLLLAFILIFGGSTAIVWRLFGSINQAPISNIQTPGVRVKISTLQVGMVQESSDFVANIESQYSVELPSKIAGQVSQILIKSGEQVSEGAAILQVDSRPQTLEEINAAKQAAMVERENARAKLQSLEAARQSQITDLELQQKDYERYASLAEQGAIPRRTQEQYASKLSTAKAQLNAIDAQIQGEQSNILEAETAFQKAEEDLRNRQNQPRNYRITAPFSGTVGNLTVQVGDLVTTFTPLVTVSQNKPLEINISVPAAKSSQLREGLPVEILNPQGEIITTSKIADIARNEKNEEPGSVITALLNNSEGLLKPHQLVRARVIWNQRYGVLVPTRAVSRIGGETFVYVVQTEASLDGESQLIARKRRVNLGNIRDDHYQVLAGLQPEEKIVTSGLLNLKDGALIVPES